MAPWVRKMFVEFLPKYLFIQRPDKDDGPNDDNDITDDSQKSQYLLTNTNWINFPLTQKKNGYISPLKENMYELDFQHRKQDMNR